jgi:GAF domain-containing protein
VNSPPVIAGDAAWRAVLDLGEQLMAQPTVAAQRDLIVDSAAQLAGGEARLWLVDLFDRSPDGVEPASPLFAAPSELMSEAIEMGQPRLANGDSGASVAIPLRAHDVTLGVLQVDRAAGPPFASHEISLLDGLAVQSAVALHSSRQVQMERWRVEQLALVRMVSAQVASVFDLDELCRRVTRLILETFEYYYVALFTHDPGQEILRFRASAGPFRADVGPDQISRPLHVRSGQGIIGHVVETGEAILAQDVSVDPHYRYEDSLPETRSEVALPLKIGKDVLGVLDVQSDQPDDFQEIDMLVLQALADNIAIAVEDARLYGDLERRAKHMSAVAEVTGAVASILDLDALFEKAVILIHEKLGYPSARLFTVDGACSRVTFQAGSGRYGQVREGCSPACRIEKDCLICWVARQGEPVLIDDVRDDARYRSDGLIHPDSRSVIIVPLVYGGEVLGVLDVQSDVVAVFTDDDLLLLKTLTDNLSVAVRNANLYRSERWRRKVADSLREVAGLLSAEVDLDQVLDAILVELERTLPCDAAGIWLLEGNSLCLSAVRGYGKGVCVGELYLDSESWLSEALEATKPAIRTPDSPFEPLGAGLEFPVDYSAIAAPMLAGDKRLGLLVLVHREAGRYGGESRLMTAAFASYAAVAIENTRLYQETQELALISTVMLRVVEATQSLATLTEVLSTIVRLVPMLAGVDRCAILLWDGDAPGFVPAASHGLDSHQDEVFAEWCVLPGDEPLFDDLLLNKAPVFIYDTATDPRLSGVDLWAMGFKASLVLPFLAQGKILGAMLMEYSGDWFGVGGVETLRDERLAIIQGIAHQAASAVESTQLREAQQEEAYVSAALLQVAQAVASLNSLDEILGTIVRIMPLLVGVEACIIFLWDDRRAQFRPAQAYGVARGAVANLQARRYFLGDFPLLDLVYAHGNLVAYPDDGGDLVPDDFLIDVLDRLPEMGQPILAVPLVVKDDVLGVMVLAEREAAHRFREKRLQIITGIADQVSMAVQSDLLQQEMVGRERLERELQLAHEIQQTFIPTELPQPPGWDLAAVWRAARQVAGDFYDIFELPGGRLGLVIADVADKGMPAALFMTLTRTLMRAAAIEEASASGVMRRVNDLLVPDAEHGMFVTAIYAVLSPEAGKLTYSNAGHTLPLLLRSDTGEVEPFKKGSMALGVLEGVQFEDHSIFLKPGDAIVFYTDGVTEAFSPQGEMYGEERLEQTVATGAASAQALLDAVAGSALDFMSDPVLSDDLTLVVLRRQADS